MVRSPALARLFGGNDWEFIESPIVLNSVITKSWLLSYMLEISRCSEWAASSRNPGIAFVLGCQCSPSEAVRGGLPGNFYTLVTGSNERRWGKVRPRLEEIAKSFTVVDRFAAN